MTRRGRYTAIGVVIVVLLSLRERFDIDGWDDPRFKAESPEPAADKVRAEAGFHAIQRGNFSNSSVRPRAMVM